eukprot:4086430-Alexandrium_andersonii.AAC.1
MWLDCKESWGCVVLTEQVMELTKQMKSTTRKWLNAAQMIEHYKCESVVLAIIAEKLKTHDGWRPCPDAPLEEKAREYDCR